MAELRTYRTYRFIEKDPVIDKMRTLVQDEGLYKNLQAVHEISGVSATTLHNWFHGDTRQPRHSTIAAVASSLGYEEQFVKARDIDIETERKLGAAWLRREEAPDGPSRGREEKKKPGGPSRGKANGTAGPAAKRRRVLQGDKRAKRKGTP